MCCQCRVDFKSRPEIIVVAVIGGRVNQQFFGEDCDRLGQWPSYKPGPPGFKETILRGSLMHIVALSCFFSFLSNSGLNTYC